MPGMLKKGPKIQKLSLWLCLLMGLASCTTAPISLMDSRPGMALSAGETARVRFFTNIADFDTGIVLTEGGRYALSIDLLSYWVDGSIEKNENGDDIDERGFANSEMTWSWLGHFRRSNDHRWFELMLYQPRCAGESLSGVSDLEFDESSSNYYFVANCDGKLALFVNDNYVAYANNLGYANIALSRVN